MGKGVLGIPHLPLGHLSAGTCTALGAWLAAMDLSCKEQIIVTWYKPVVNPLVYE